MMIVLTPEQAAFLRPGVKAHGGLLPPIPMNDSHYLALCCVAQFTGFGGMRITPSGFNAVHWHDAHAS